jgi:Arylsulfotransferase (ASST)
LRSAFKIRIPLGKILPAVSILAFGCLAFIGGAAVMHFSLFSADFLRNAFTGAEAWRAREQMRAARPSDVYSDPKVTVDQPEKTYDGFTLFTLTEGCGATLIDMRGKVVHRWGIPFSKVWANAPHIRNQAADDHVHWFRCHLYPNGDVLAVFHGEGDTPYGYGLVKLNRDSTLLWSHAANVHHDVDIDEDGVIYTLTQKLRPDPPGNLPISNPYIADYLVLLSPEGREIKSIPLLETIQNSPYALLLKSIPSAPTRPGFMQSVIRGMPPPPVKSPTGELPPPPLLGGKLGDVLHTNSVRVLSRTRSARFPLFAPGQVLISLRNLDALIVVDPKVPTVVWAARGVWQLQHDAQFLDNGHLLLYDNMGAFKGSRILEYDPVTQAIPWSYQSDLEGRFNVFIRGTNQRLPNRNTLISEPKTSRIFEITPSKEIVWDCTCSPPILTSPDEKAMIRAVNGARRYSPGELQFLKGDARARP